MPVSYRIDRRDDGWHVHAAGADDRVFATRESAISWIAQFGGGGAHAVGTLPPPSPSREARNVEPYLPPEAAPAAEHPGAVDDDLDELASGVDPEPAPGGPEP